MSISMSESTYLALDLIFTLFYWLVIDLRNKIVSFFLEIFNAY